MFQKYYAFNVKNISLFKTLCLDQLQTCKADLKIEKFLHKDPKNTETTIGSQFVQQLFRDHLKLSQG